MPSDGTRRRSFLASAERVLSRQQMRRIQRAFEEDFSQITPWVASHDIDHDHHCTIQGQTNEYTVHYKCDQHDGVQMRCTCPDWILCRREGMLCKHCCFLLLGISLGRDDDLTYFQQVAANSHARSRCSLSADAFQVAPSEWPALTEEECPICYEALAEAALCRRCPDCSKVLHVTCIKKCLRNDKRCPWCRGEGSWWP